jgi:hypothetical protein
MAKKIKLREICHSRSGDKRDIGNVGLVVYDRKHYDWIREHVTADRVREWFKESVHGKVERFELPGIGALNFVMYEALDGGASRSLIIDPYGKALSAVLLDMEIAPPPA